MIDTTNIVQPPEWMLDGACTEVDGELFFPGKNESARPAVRVCAGCGVREACRAYALEHRIEDGVWGGVDPARRRRMLTRLDRAGQGDRAGDAVEVDEVALARLMAGRPVPTATRLEVATAAVRLHLGGQGASRIAERLGVADRQVWRWISRYRAGQPLCPPAGRHRAGV